MKYQFKGKTTGGDWIIGSLVEAKKTAFIVPSHLVFSQSKWRKVDPKTVSLVEDADCMVVESKMNAE